MIECRAPKNNHEMQQYFDLRWKILRKPWQQPQGSEQDEFEQQAIHRLVIDERGAVCAVGRLHFSGGHQAQIRYMAVAESQQHKGYGKMIIDALESAAREYGIREITLNAREQAHGFYLHLGYQGEQVSHVLYDEIVHIKMKKQLAEAEDDILVQQLVDTWHNTIPLSKAMAIYIARYCGDTLLCSCDVQANKNLHHTMFAGSIYTLATLTGWGAIYLKLVEQQLSGDIVLAHAEIKYKAPISDVAFAKTSQLIKTISFHEQPEKSRVKISLSIGVYSGELLAAVFTGQYVVIFSES